MAIVLARVDDRLIHGQVMEAWAPCLRADAVLVADDAAWGNSSRRRLLECLAGKGVEVGVLPLSDLPAALASREGKRVIVLFSSLASAADAVERGLPVRTLNVGNLHHPDCLCWQVAPSIFLDEGDLALVDKLRQRGVGVEGRDVPEGRPVELSRAAVEGARGVRGEGEKRGG